MNQGNILEELYTNLLTLLSQGETEENLPAAAATSAALSTVHKILSSGPQDNAALLREGMLRRLTPLPHHFKHSGEDVHRVQQTPLCILELLVLTLRYQEFECRKDTEAVVADLMSTSPAALEFFSKELLLKLCQSYEWCNYGAVALNSGNILRMALRHEQVLRRLLNFESPEPLGGHTVQHFEESLLKRFFKYVDVIDFEVASDAFWTFRDLMTKNQQIASEYLHVHFTPFFTNFNKLLQPQQNYVTRRQSLKILGELLLTKANFRTMQKYTQSTQFLKSVMVMLKDTSSHIKFEAFHVFKLFVANPLKSDGVKLILAMNKERLLGFFEKFGEAVGEGVDKSLVEEKALVVKEIKALEAPPTKQRNGGYSDGGIPVGRGY